MTPLADPSPRPGSSGAGRAEPPAEPATQAPADPLAELLAEVRRIQVHSRRLVRGVMSGGYASVFRGAGLSFESVREYAEGDDPRALDWNVTARMGRPYVKTFVEERDQTVLFLLDLSASMEGGFGPWSARGTAARVVACLAFAAVRGGDRVGLLGFSDRVRARVPPRRGEGHALRLVRDCLALSAPGGATDLGAALAEATRAARRHAVVFVVSDFLTQGYEQALARAARRHDVIAVRLLLPEHEAPPPGLVRVQDPETGRARVVDFGSARTRAVHAAAVQAWRRATEEACARARVDLLDVPVPRSPVRDAVAGPIVRFFRMRERRGAKR